MRPNTEADFWKHVDQSPGPDSCWPWQKFINPRGYGYFSYQGRNWLSHRLALHFSGVAIDDLVVCHHCDNPRCCNPAHLYAGTPKTNSQDARDRNRLWSAPGSQNPWSKLTEAQVLHIRSLPFRQALDLYGSIVSRGQICQIRYNKKSWRHI